MGSETRWTKGPWSIGDESDSHASICIGETLADVGRDDPHGCAYLIDRNEMLANAHLITAAPELYEALEAYHHHFGILEDNSFVNEEARRCCHMARAALAKARGEQS